MPYRAMLYTLLTVALALVLVGVWLHTVAPLVLTSEQAQTLPNVAVATLPPLAAHEQAKVLGHPDPAIHKFVNGIMLLAFLLLCLLLLVGFFATFREWVRFQTTPRAARVPKKTTYVDAWKLSAERMGPQSPPVGPGDLPPHQ